MMKLDDACNVLHARLIVIVGITIIIIMRYTPRLVQWKEQQLWSEVVLGSNSGSAIY